MKNVMFLLALLLVACVPLNGCNAIKHKLQTNFSNRVKNDVKVAKEASKSVLGIDAFKSAKSNTTVKETITYKTPARNSSDETIELTASFQIDTARSLKGDTALTLTGPGVSLTIVRNPKTNSLTATIKKNGRSKKVDVNELRIDRTTTNNVELLDTTKSKLTWDELKIDSVDKTQQKTEQKHFEKEKKVLPVWGIWIIVTVVVCGLIFLYFKR